MGGKGAVVSQHVKVWRRDERTKAADEIHWVEQDGMGPVAPGLLEAQAYASIGIELEALLAQRGPCDVAAHALEALSAPAIDGHRGVDVYPTHLGDGERVRLYQREPRGPGELVGPLTRSRAQELQVACRSSYAGGEDRLLAERAVRCGLVRTLEVTAVPSEHYGKPLVGPSRDLHHVVRSRRRQGMEVELSCLVSNPDSVGRECMKVDIEPQRRVAALHERDRPDMRIVDRAQPQLALGPPAKRAQQRPAECIEHIAAQTPVVADQHAHAAQAAVTGATPRRRQRIVASTSECPRPPPIHG